VSTQQPIRNKSDIENISKMSSLQQGILFHSLQQEDGDPYFYQFGFDIEGRFDPSLFNSAWEQVARHYQVLRTNYRWEEVETPLQIVFKTPLMDIEVVDLQGVSAADAEVAIKQSLQAVKQAGYDFRQGSPVALKVFVRSAERWSFHWSLHHISLDGWSVSKVLGDLLQCYEALLDGKVYTISSSLPYTRYIQWVHEQDKAALDAHWRATLAGFDEKTPLPLIGDYSDTRYAERPVLFSREDSELIRAAARAHGVTVNTLVQAAWGLLLVGYAQGDEVLFGVTTSGRSAALPGLQTVVGLCINTLPLRIAIDPQLEVGQWLRQIQAQSAESREFEFSSLPELVKYSDLPEGDSLFDSILVFENYPIDEALKQAPAGLWVRQSGDDREHVEADGVIYRGGRNNYAISVIANLGDQLELILAYHCQYYSDNSVAELACQLKHHMMSLARSGSQPLGRLTGLTTVVTDTQRQVLAGSKQVFADHDFLALWHQSVTRWPDRLALVHDGRSLDYAALEQRSNQLAHYLLSRGIGVGSTVALCHGRTLEWVISLLAVLKCGATYLPLDHQQPVERLQQLLQDSAATLLIHAADEPKAEQLNGCPTLAYDVQHWSSFGTDPLAVTVHPLQAAYIIYTSGSTGQPKGVVVSHQALANYLQAVRQRLDLPSHASMALVSTVAADLGHTLLFGALVSGCPLHLLSYEHAFDPDLFAQYMLEHRIDVLKIVPSHLSSLMQATNAADVLPERALIVGGEACSWALMEKVRMLKPHCRIINHYGPTETTVGVSTHEVAERLADSHSVPIGLPLNNVHALILDTYLNPVPQLVAGELYLGGETLAQGYLGRPAATAERFIPTENGKRLYRTGDRVRMTRDALLEFIGRADDQVKIRGYRVEPGEVGQVLGSLPGVREAVVLALPMDSDESRLQLVGYAAVDDGLDSQTLQQGMQQILPEYLVPSQFILLERLPLTANGKLDKRALPKPGAIKHQYTAPINEIESTLASVWAEVLKLEQVGTTDNFFELGGDSILCLQIIARSKRRGIKLTPKQVFEKQTISQLAQVASQIESNKPTLATPGTDTVAVDGKKTTAPLEFSLAGLSQAQLDDLPIPLPEIEDIYPLSPMQEGMLFHSLFAENGGDYVNQVRVSIDGLDVERLRRAWQAAIDRHEVLRASFISFSGRSLQVIRKRLEVPFAILDWRGHATLEDQLDDWARADQRKGFDMARDPLLRVAVIRTGDNSHCLVLTMHHILVDGWSSSQLLGEVLQVYAGHALEPQVSRYRDYIEWLGQQDRAVSERFWKERLNLLEAPTMLAQAIRSGEETPAIAGYGDHREALSIELTDCLNVFAREQRVTLNTLMQAAWLLLLQRYSGQDCVAFGATVAGRPTELKGVEQQLGLFINTLPVIANPRSDLRVGEWLAQVQAENLMLREHEHTPLYEIQGWAGLSGRGLFDTILAFENYPVADALRESAPDGLVFRDLSSQGHTSYPLTLAIYQGEALTIHYSYDRKRFSDHAIRRIANHFVHLLTGLSRNAQAVLAELPLLDDQEQQQLIRAWNQTQASYPSEACIHQLIEQQVIRAPEAMALTFGEQSLSYGELNRRANRLAHKLRELGVGPDVLVGIAVERSLEMVIGLLGILKAGGAYVPLDPEYPQDRLAYMMEDSGIGLLLTQGHLASSLPVPESVTCLALEAGEEWLSGYGEDNLEHQVQPEDLAYVIYTSGSTGKPKGAGNAHRALVNRLCWMQKAYGLVGEDRVLQKTPFSFDVSVWEFFWPLMSGASLIIAQPGEHRDPQRLIETIERHAVTTLHFVPSMLQVFLAVERLEGCRSIKRVICSGEALPAELARKALERLPSAGIFNLYGPTEAAIDVTHWTCTGEEEVGVPIGRPIDNLKTHILGAGLLPAVQGSVGELYLGGVGLARGYHARPALTAERFIPDPFDEQGGGRLYRTGDLARYRDDGVIEYVGRIDHQVKIRGFRIELGEIEAKLLEDATIREAVVLAQEGPAGKQLVAYLVPAGELAEEQRQALCTSLRERLKAVLPDYMVPTYLLLLDALPVTANGKLDRRSLPVPDAGQNQQAYVAPTTELEQQVATIWAEVLKVERVGLADSFFDLGGHSLLATQMVIRVREQLAVSVSLRDVFDFPCLADFVLSVEGRSIQENPLQKELAKSLEVLKRLTGEEIDELIS